MVYQVERGKHPLWVVMERGGRRGDFGDKHAGIIISGGTGSAGIGDLMTWSCCEWWRGEEKAVEVGKRETRVSRRGVEGDWDNHDPFIRRVRYIKRTVLVPPITRLN